IVCLFALVGQAAKPKRFAGIFSAAPTVALANLTVVVLAAGTKDIRSYGLGMLVGSAAFVVYALLSQPTLDRFGALRGSALPVAIVAVPPLVSPDLPHSRQCWWRCPSRRG